MNNQFIQLQTAQLAPFKLTGLADAPVQLRFVLARFEVQHFEPALFAECGIAYPYSMQTSVSKRQAEFLAGRLCAAQALQAYGLQAHSVPIGPRREPLWPIGYVGSISHAKGYAAAIVQTQEQFVGVGLDLEARLSADSQQAMLDVVLNQRERQRILSYAKALDRADLLTLLFSAKESFFKAAYPQVQDYFDFDVLEFISLDMPSQLLEFVCVTELSAGLRAGQKIQARYQYLSTEMLLSAVLLPAA